MFNRRPQHKIQLYTNKILFVLLCFCGILAKGQSASRSSNQLQCNFSESEINYEEVAAISNVLKIHNKSNRDVTVKVRVIAPSGWRSLTNSDKQYVVTAKDTLFIPVRLIANANKVKGGFKYNIMAAVTAVENGQVATASFVAGKPKVVNMKMEIKPGNRLYFLNGKSFLPFAVELINDGNERQDMFLSLSKLGNDAMITDSSGKFLQRKHTQLTVKAFSDTLLPYGLALLSEVRNQRRIDTYGYVFDQHDRARRHTVFVKAVEPGPAPKADEKNENTKARISKTVDFLKLNSVKKVSEYNGDRIPLTVMSNINQLFNQQPVMNLTLNGRKIIDQHSYLTYFTQNTFSYYKVNDQTYRNTFGQIGYFHDRGSVQIGTGVQLSMPQVRTLGTGGPGVSATYYLAKGHKIGASYSGKAHEGLSFDKSTANLAYTGTVRKITGGLGFSLAHSNPLFRTEVSSFGLSAPIGRLQNISVRASYEGYKTNTTRYSGYLLSLNYSIRYLKNTASTRTQLMYHKIPGFVLNNDSLLTRPLINGGIFNTIQIKKLFTINTQHNYYENPVYDLRIAGYQKNRLLSNLVFFGFLKKTKTILVPGTYFNYSEYYSQRMLSEGLQVNLSRSEIQENMRLGVTLKGGFSKLVSHPQYGTFFTGQANAFANYHTWNFNARYFYGPQSQFDVLSTLSRNTKYSQVIFASVGNQYQFKNRHFILENTFSYNYVYINLRQTTSLFTQLYYFAQSGWRINFNFTFNYNVSDNIRYTYNTSAPGNYQSENSTEKQKNKSLQFGLGIKKEFGIPIPEKFVKHRFTTARFKAFLDLNGNRQFDADEASLENIVIRLNDYEVQTDINGEAAFENIQLGTYQMQILSLENLGAWFAIKDDSVSIAGSGVMFVPFSRGVQVMGNVELNREKFSAGMKGSIDVSRIKIFVIDSAGKTVTTLTDRQGEFNFYLPYGRYTIRFDESVLGSDFELAENDVVLHLISGMESYYHTFFVTERKRKVKTKKFGADGQMIPDNTVSPGNGAQEVKDEQNKRK